MAYGVGHQLEPLWSGGGHVGYLISYSANNVNVTQENSKLTLW
jgi:hypothetical protein